jgi:hypothetical protein
VIICDMCIHVFTESLPPRTGHLVSSLMLRLTLFHWQTDQSINPFLGRPPKLCVEHIVLHDIRVPEFPTKPFVE